MVKPTHTDDQILAQIPAARARARQRPESRVTRALYDRGTGRIVMELANGCQVAFPTDLAQGLHGADPEDLAEVQVVLGGTALRWDRLDADLLVTGLLQGVFGSRAWMGQVAREMGRRGGQARSEAKAAAARLNGRKGGRPRKGG